ncbi:uncharacterized protein C11orf24 homolog isoform X1 [Etheostoma spectabile]|uniref:uncharacterized protein C11orf24 homolog isoform X1 n=1 Tax=Etheostoma spectabile TaxID=54343 RepID=UPI0013AEE098|nr:uncharacterized protein C11orf24 homolog isoform X1 [Etheostoma spectabile]
MFACVCKLMPTMSPCPSTLQLTLLVCLGLLCLLLFTDSPGSKKGPTQPPNTTQANCSAAHTGGVCSPGDDGDVSENATAGPLKAKPEDQFPTNSSLPTSHTSVSRALNDSVAQTPPSTTTGLATQAAHSGTTTTSSTGAATAAAVQPVGNVVTPTSLGTSAATTPTSTTLMTTKTAITTPRSAATTATSTTLTTETTAIIPPSAATAAASTTPPVTATSKAAVPHPETSVKARTRLTTANPTVALTTTNGTKMSPPPPSVATPHHALSTEKPPVQTSLPTGPTTSPSTPTGHSAPVAPGPRVPAVDVAGAPLTKQLVDTASLLSVLLFGLLFFLVTVAVFVTQAYESYRRKDYTQVDYLINGMYSDSGV